MDDLLRDFLTETLETIDQVDAELVRFEQEPDNQRVLGHIFRLFHTIKGTCGFVGLHRLERLTHAAESAIGGFGQGAPVTAAAITPILASIDRIKLILRAVEGSGAEPEGGDEDLIAALLAIADTEPLGEQAPDIDEILFGGSQTPNAAALEPDHRRADMPSGTALPSETAGHSIRVGIETIDQLMTAVSELVLTRNQLMEITRQTDDAKFKLPLQRLSTVTAELQESVMKARMQPIGKLWRKLPRLARDLAAELGKEIDIVFHGAETELDRQVLDCIKDPLTHLIRNAVDHGIESGPLRKALGKPARGTIRLGAYHEGGTITIEIADDGRGLDIEAIRARLRGEGMVPEAELERMSEAKLARYIFHPGFSTASAVSHISGRGVGLDVVRSNIEEIGGSVDIGWKPGHGTVFSIKIPLTLAIVSALIVESRGQRFAIPQSSIVELARTRPGSDHRVEVINGRGVLRLRDKLLPIGHLADVLKLRETQPQEPLAKGFIVVMKVGRVEFGLFVNSVIHTEDIVIKPMSRRLRQIGVFSGTTILGDGHVILILDPNGLASSIGEAAGHGEDAADPPVVQPIRAEAAKTPLLLFRAGSDTRAAPLSLVARLEEIDAGDIEYAAGRAMVQYRGELIPILAADPRSNLRTEGLQPLLIVGESGRAMGLAVDEIVDIVEEPLDIRLGAGEPGLLGSAVVGGRATAILDIAYFMLLAHPDWIGSAPGKPRADERPRRLLLIEGSPFFRAILIPILGSAGYEIVAAADLDQAMEIDATVGPFDAMVCDIDSASEQGFAMMEKALHRGLRPVATSARPGALAIARARALGLGTVASKFHRDAILAALRETCMPLGAAA